MSRSILCSLIFFSNPKLNNVLDLAFTEPAVEAGKIAKLVPFDRCKRLALSDVQNFH